MEKNTARLEAFSDGIFGVAITLLAIEIGIDEYANPTNESLWEQFKEKWPEYFTFFNSFGTVLLVWMGHRKIIDHLKSVNHWIVLLNGFVLLMVVFYPFPTRMVGTFIDSPAVGTATAIYSAITGSITLSMLLLNIGILNNEHILSNPVKSRKFFKQMIKGQIFGIILYAMATIISFYSAITALAIDFLLWIFCAILSKDEQEQDITYENI